MSGTHPPLPALHYGAVKAKRPSTPSLVKWSVATVALAVLLYFSMNASTDNIPLGYTTGNRDSWNPAEIFWFVFTFSAVAWLIYSSVVWSARHYQYDSDLREGQRYYAADFIAPWIKEKYGVDVTAEEADYLLRGDRIRLYRTNDEGHTEWVRAILQGSSNIRGVAEPESYYTPRYSKDVPLTLLVLPEPTKPPAPYEFYSAEQSRADA